MRSSNGKILNYSGMTAYEGKSGPEVVILSITDFYHCWCHRFLSLLVPVTGIVICFEYSFSLSFLVIEQMVMWHLATQPKCYFTQPSLQLTVALWHRSSQWEGVVTISRKSHNREGYVLLLPEPHCESHMLRMEKQEDEGTMGSCSVQSHLLVLDCPSRPLCKREINYYLAYLFIQITVIFLSLAA